MQVMQRRVDKGLRGIGNLLSDQAGGGNVYIR
jgi:hypothetical protein